MEAPEPTGVAESLDSNSVETITLAVAGVKESDDEAKVNCVWSENNINFSPIFIAFFKIATLVWDAATSIGSLSITDNTVSAKKLKNSETLESITLSLDKKPNLFLKKKTLFIVDPIKEGLGADVKSPTVLSPHLGKVKLLVKPKLQLPLVVWELEPVKLNVLASGTELTVKDPSLPLPVVKSTVTELPAEKPWLADVTVTAVLPDWL